MLWVYQLAPVFPRKVVLFPDPGQCIPVPPESRHLVFCIAMILFKSLPVTDPSKRRRSQTVSKETEFQYRDGAFKFDTGKLFPNRRPL